MRQPLPGMPGGAGSLAVLAVGNASGSLQQTLPDRCASAARSSVFD
ncbi:hypothetical protein LN458_06605 [Xanthomonas arboricola]|nr:hypothetical protein [Xanthomonas arboricola]MCC8473663.1 hypothetical protein [Xanthomonas arboricola]